MPEEDASDVDVEKSLCHRHLSRLVGEWEGVSRTWFEPGKLADESPISGSFRKVLDGRFVVHEYQGSLQGKRVGGMAVHGYAKERARFVTAWMDGFHMGTDIMLSDGEGGIEEDRFSVLGSYRDPRSDSRWGWRTEIELLGDDAMTIIHYNIDPEGDEAKAVEIQYKRKA